MEITVEASPNFALTKYWGKSKAKAPGTGAAIPATPSIGITVSGIASVCRIRLDDPALEDAVHVNGTQLSRDEYHASSAIIAALRRITGFSESVHIDSWNSFPTSAGAASSSSGMAAIAFGLTQLLNLTDDTISVSELAQAGSVSTARAALGGFVHLPATRSATAQQLFSENHWEDLRVLLCITSRERKEISSRKAMQVSQETSPLFSIWKKQAQLDTRELLAAVESRDLERLGSVAEKNALLMHTAAMTSTPSILFWNPGTVAVLQAVHELRKSGTYAYCTMDAGPQVKIICDKSSLAQIIGRLSNTPLVLDLIPLTVGGGPRLARTEYNRNRSAP